MNPFWWQNAAPTPSVEHQQQAQARQNQLTKPPGSLGKLEQIAINFAGWQKREQPILEKIGVRIFAADHGVVAEGVSAFPQAVTAEMVRNFSRGGAAVTVLAKRFGADFKVINLGTVEPLEELLGVEAVQLAPGTQNFCQEPAMDDRLLQHALDNGRQYLPEHCDLFIGGEMGIGNTTAAAALCSALLDLPAATSVGRGSGLDDAGVAAKKAVVEKALQQHQEQLTSPLAILQHLGGLEIAGLCGAYIAAAQRGIPSLVDGFICSAAALVACRLNPSVRSWLLFSHHSAESGHTALLNAMDAEPLVNLNMRLGEGSGAMVVIPLVEIALALHQQMATFAEAGVSEGGGS